MNNSQILKYEFNGVITLITDVHYEYVIIVTTEYFCIFFIPCCNLIVTINHNLVRGNQDLLIIGRRCRP